MYPRTQAQVVVTEFFSCMGKTVRLSGLCMNGRCQTVKMLRSEPLWWTRIPSSESINNRSLVNRDELQWCGRIGLWKDTDYFVYYSSYINAHFKSYIFPVYLSSANSQFKWNWLFKTLSSWHGFNLFSNNHRKLRNQFIHTLLSACYDFCS